MTTETTHGATPHDEAAPPTNGTTNPTANPGHPTPPVVEEDHAGASETKREKAESKEAAKGERAERRKRLKSGTLGGGKWELVGRSLVNMDALTKVDLPTEGDEPPVITFTTASGGTVAATGDEARELMESLGLEPLPPLPGPAGDTVTESGRLVSQKDLAAEASPRRISTVPIRNPIGGPPPLPPILPPEDEDDEDEAPELDEEGKPKPKAKGRKAKGHKR